MNLHAKVAQHKIKNRQPTMIPGITISGQNGENAANNPPSVCGSQFLVKNKISTMPPTHNIGVYHEKTKSINMLAPLLCLAFCRIVPGSSSFTPKFSALV